METRRCGAELGRQELELLGVADDKQTVHQGAANRRGSQKTVDLKAQEKIHEMRNQENTRKLQTNIPKPESTTLVTQMIC